jgi:SEC-C motif-containing protein
MRAMIAPHDPCPCGGPSLESCCGPALSGVRPAPTAEALMRSRYTAYVVQDIGHLVRSHAAETRDSLDVEALERWAEGARWLGLEIVAVEGGGPGTHEGSVEFRARYEADGATVTHHERSSFRRDAEGWVYVDGELPEARRRAHGATPKTGRNEPCPCGSGKKYKRCCGG